MGCVIYFDHNATTPLTAPARAAWLRAQDEAWVNPASPYREAARIRRDALAALAAAGGTPPRWPDGIEDRTGGPVKEGRKTAGDRS